MGEKGSGFPQESDPHLTENKRGKRPRYGYAKGAKCIRGPCRGGGSNGRWYHSSANISRTKKAIRVRFTASDAARKSSFTSHP